jgi:hypothetical protein
LNGENWFGFTSMNIHHTFIWISVQVRTANWFIALRAHGIARNFGAFSHRGNLDSCLGGTDISLKATTVGISFSVGTTDRKVFVSADGGAISKGLTAVLRAGAGYTGLWIINTDWWLGTGSNSAPQIRQRNATILGARSSETLLEGRETDCLSWASHFSANIGQVYLIFRNTRKGSAKVTIAIGGFNTFSGEGTID